MKTLKIIIIAIALTSCEEDLPPKYTIKVGSSSNALGFKIASYQIMDGWVKCKTITGKEFQVKESEVLKITEL